MPDGHADAAGGMTAGRSRLPQWILLAAVVFALDQITKFGADRWLTLFLPHGLTSFLSLTLTHNTGAAFSILANQPGWQRWFFIALGLAVCGAILWWLTRLPVQARWQSAALSLIMGGALGNVWDRIQYGYVVDFIDFHYHSWHFPAFNVADSSITIGAVMLVIDALRAPRGT